MCHSLRIAAESVDNDIRNCGGVLFAPLDARFDTPMGQGGVYIEMGGLRFAP